MPHVFLPPRSRCEGGRQGQHCELPPWGFSSCLKSLLRPLLHHRWHQRDGAGGDRGTAEGRPLLRVTKETFSRGVTPGGTAGPCPVPPGNRRRDGPGTSPVDGTRGQRSTETRHCLTLPWSSRGRAGTRKYKLCLPRKRSGSMGEGGHGQPVQLRPPVVSSAGAGQRGPSAAFGRTSEALPLCRGSAACQPCTGPGGSGEHGAGPCR